MPRFKIWAPNASKAELRLGERTLPLSRTPEGSWLAETEPGSDGEDYGFLIDDEGPFPDPRSECQPEGVHGLSRKVNHEKFIWNDSAFRAHPLNEAVFYELHVGTFTREGTFLAAIEKLSHLVELGITHVELMPIASFPGIYGWGYDGVGLFAPHRAYGKPEDLKQLVLSCHARGLAVILDVVYNHLGPSGNYLDRFGPYFSKRYQNPWGPSINFDGVDHDEVRRFFCDNALMWLRDYHFDGLRLDAVHAIIDISAKPFLEQLKEEVDQLESQVGRKLVLIAESDLNAPRLLLPPHSGGCGLDAQWNDDFHNSLHSFLTGEQSGYYADFGSLAHLAKAMRQGFVYDGCYSKYRHCHFGRPRPMLSGNQLLGYLQNHDQIGNRAHGERAGHLLSVDRARLGAALVLLSPFVPLIFQGEEWNATTPFLYFADHPDSPLAQAVRDGRQKEFAAFGWQPQAIPDPCSWDTFQRSKLNWSERAQPLHSAMLAWYRQLIDLRHSEPDLQASGLLATPVYFDEQAKWLVMQRGAFEIVCNFATQGQSIPVRNSNLDLRLYSSARPRLAGSHAELPPESIAVFHGGTRLP